MSQTHSHENEKNTGAGAHAGATAGSSSQSHAGEVYQDIFQPIPKEATEADAAVISAVNAKHDKVYRALRYVLINDFGYANEIPLKPQDFPGPLNERHRAAFASIYGLLLADNYDDPMMGKDRPTGDDIVAADGSHTPVMIERRFADAVVAAVQEYTARADLFTQVFHYLRHEGGSSPSAVTRSARSSTGASV